MAWFFKYVVRFNKEGCCLLCLCTRALLSWSLCFVFVQMMMEDWLEVPYSYQKSKDVITRSREKVVGTVGGKRLVTVLNYFSLVPVYLYSYVTSRFNCLTTCCERNDFTPFPGHINQSKNRVSVSRTVRLKI